MSGVEDLERPVAPPTTSQRLADWLEWFGVARLVTTAIAVVVVCGGGWWLLRSPPPPTEAGLPVATTSTTLATVVDVGGDGGAATPTSIAGPVVVHVTGAVRRPGVHELPAGSRVADAVDAAGGVVGDADTGAINLAAVVPDGARVIVPTVGSTLPVDAPSGIDTGAPSVAGESSGVGGAPVDVNRADEATLQTLPGVGPATAAAIVLEREEHGPFSSIDDLERVPGIGPVRLAAISELVTT